MTMTTKALAAVPLKGKRVSPNMTQIRWNETTTVPLTTFKPTPFDKKCTHNGSERCVQRIRPEIKLPAAVRASGIRVKKAQRSQESPGKGRSLSPEKDFKKASSKLHMLILDAGANWSMSQNALKRRLLQKTRII